MAVLCPRNKATLEKPAGGEVLGTVMKMVSESQIKASCILLGVHYTELHSGTELETHDAQSSLLHGRTPMGRGVANPSRLGSF